MNVQIRGADETANGGTDTSPALKKLLQATTESGRLYSVTVFNTNAGAQYVQIHDTASTPAVNAVPKIQVKVLGDDDRSVDYGDGRLFKYGIFIGISTASGQYVAGADDCLIDCTFRRGRK